MKNYKICIVIGFMLIQSVILYCEVSTIEKVRVLENKSEKLVKIQFLNEKSNILKEVALKQREKYAISRNKKYIAIQKPSIKKQMLEIYNENGDLIRNQEVLAYDQVYIASNGYFVIFGDEITSEIPTFMGLAFYDTNGNLIKEDKINSFGSIGIMFDQEGLFIALYPISISSDQGWESVLACYNLRGEKLWEHNIYYMCPYGEETLNINENNGKIILKTSSKNLKTKMTYVFNKDGILLSKIKGW